MVRIDAQARSTRLKADRWTHKFHASEAWPVDGIIRGVGTESNMLLVQLTDLHVTTTDTALGSALDPVARLDQAVQLLNQLERTPDAVICTGDLVDIGTAEEYRLLRECLDRLKARWFVLPGNHDAGPAFAETFGDRPEVPAEAPFQWVSEVEGVRLIGLDTSWPDRHDGALDTARLNWLAAVLADAPDTPAVVALHHPPMTTGMWWMDYGGIEGASEFRRVIETNPQVMRVISGHVHRSVQTNWGSTVVSAAGSMVLQSGLGLTDDSVPMLHDLPLRAPLFVIEDGQLTAFELALEPAKFSVKLEDLVSDWATYERTARAGGPMARLNQGETSGE